MSAIQAAIHACPLAAQPRVFTACCPLLRRRQLNCHRAVTHTRSRHLKHERECPSLSATRRAEDSYASSANSMAAVAGAAATAAESSQQQQPSGSQIDWIRTAAWMLGLGSLLLWRFSVIRTASAASFASVTLSNSFNSASQIGFSGAIRSAIAGFAAGLLHTLAGADHLAALTPLTIGRSPAKAGLFGALWGFGHSAGQLILGLCLVLLKSRFENIAPALAKFGSFTVGGSLIFIGVAGLIDVWQDHRAAAKEEAAGGQAALAGGPSVDVSSGGHSLNDESGSNMGVGLFANGVLFGLQPDALFAIVPALTLPSRLAASAYISMFVFGTVAAMGSYTAVIGATSQAIQKNNPWLTTNLSVLASCVATVIGTLVLLGVF